MNRSGAITPSQSEPGSDGNEGVLQIPQSSSITGTSPSDCFVLYPAHSLAGRSSREKQSVHSTATADWVRFLCKLTFVDYIRSKPSSQKKKPCDTIVAVVDGFLLFQIVLVRT